MSNLNDIFFTPAANQELTYDQVLEDVQRYFAENHASTIAVAGEGNAERATSLLKELMEQPLAHNQIWNVNFPQCELEKLRGILYDRKIADCGFFIDEYLEEGLENGRIRLTVHGNYNENAPEGTDFRALVDGYISVGKVNNLR